MILSDIGMLIVSSPRAKAYLQTLVKNNLYPSYILLLEDKSQSLLPGQLTNDVVGKKPKKIDRDQECNTFFNKNEPLIKTIEKHNLKHEICHNTDVNSKEVINRIKKQPQKYIIYSGYGGAILKKEILNCGKKFIHIHSGHVPFYKGSTTIYYGILNEDKCSVSSIFLDEKIDQGSIIKIKEYPKPKDGRSIDYDYDPYIRSDLLVEAIKDYIKKDSFPVQKQGKNGETYFIIHPVLKHIAILSCN